VDKVFRALADPSRRRLLDSLNHRTGQTLRELCAGQEMTRQSVSKHLAVLEAANLVTTVHRGRGKLHYLNAAPISDIADRWIDRYGARPRRSQELHEREERMDMTEHATGTREEWLAARLELLAAEKELTRRADELARQRQALPWVPIDKDYRFETDEGSALLADLFRGRSQLLVYHFMFGPGYTAGCPACSAIAIRHSCLLTCDNATLGRTWPLPADAR
jgi:DNA-binding transcriptional ArsR family regulator